jgi:hypothetical protein
MILCVAVCAFAHGHCLVGIGAEEHVIHLQAMIISVGMPWEHICAAGACAAGLLPAATPRNYTDRSRESAQRCKSARRHGILPLREYDSLSSQPPRNVIDPLRSQNERNLLKLTG